GPAAGLAKQCDARRSDFARWRSPGADAQSSRGGARRRHVAMKLCLERVLPRCDERPVTFCLPSFRAVGNSEANEPVSRQKVSRAMNAVTAALACGWVTPGEMATIGEVYETFVRTAGTAREEAARGNLLQILTAGDDVEDIGDAEAIDDSDP